MLDVSDTGKLKARHDDIEQMPETCSLDVADRGGETLEEIARMLGLTRERIRQIEVDALERLRAVGEMKEATMHTCARCSGVGREPIMGVGHSNLYCRLCGGSGKTPTLWIRCRRCRGDGYVLIPPYESAPCPCKFGFTEAPPPRQPR
jgi:hypothetical protein